MHKSLNGYHIKGQPNEIKDISLESREVAMYLARFDIIDSDYDMIIKGAFKKSILERGPKSESNRKIAFLRYHNWEMPIGTFKDMGEDDKGLYVVGKLGTSTLGEDALKDYDEGIIKEHSIGFRYMPDKMKFIEDTTMENGGYFKVNELSLWEGSAVTFGANQYTNVIEVSKGQEKVDMAKKLNDDIEAVTKALVGGRGSDERLYNLEMRLKFLNARMYELATTNPLEKQLDEVKAQQVEKLPAFDWNNVINNINF